MYVNVASMLVPKCQASRALLPVVFRYSVFNGLSEHLLSPDSTIVKDHLAILARADYSCNGLMMLRARVLVLAAWHNRETECEGYDMIDLPARSQLQGV